MVNQLQYFFLSLHMEVPGLGVELQLPLLAYTTATATPDLSHICNLHHSSRRCQILNPLRGPGMEPMSSWILIGVISAEPQQEFLLSQPQHWLGQ